MYQCVHTSRSQHWLQRSEQKRHWEHCTKVGNHRWAGKIHKVKGRTLFCSFKKLTAHFFLSHWVWLCICTDQQQISKYYIGKIWSGIFHKRIHMADVSFYTFPICFKLNYSPINDSSGKANELSLKAAQRALAFSSALRHIHSFPFFYFKYLLFFHKD